MNIEKLIFNIINSGAHTWVRYWKNTEMNGLTLPGEYIEIRCSYIDHGRLDPSFENGFRINKIQSIKIGADSYCDILLKRELSHEGVIQSDSNG